MILIDLLPETHFAAIITTICILFSLFIGSIILIKALKSKEKVLYLSFLVVVLIFTSWYNYFIGYIYWIITNEQIPYVLIVLINSAFYPMGLLSWMYVYIYAINPSKKKIVLGSFIILIIIHELYLFYFLFFAPNAPVEAYLATVHELSLSSNGYLLISGLIFILIGCITGIHFSISSMKRENKKEIRWKGRFLLIAYTMFFLQLIPDVLASPYDIYLILLARILLLIVIFFFYLGFVFPNWIRKLISFES